MTDSQDTDTADARNDDASDSQPTETAAARDDDIWESRDEDDVQYGDTWVYESIVGALPGVDLESSTAIGVQVVVFQVSVLFVAWLFDLWSTVLVGTAAVAVAAVGSALMLRYARRIRALKAPESYRRLLFGSNVEVVLSVLAFVSVVTHLFVYDPRTAAEPLVTVLLGETPPVLATYLLLLVLWDVVYRIGTSWWAAVAAVWRAYTFAFDEETTQGFVRADGLNLAFAVVQLLFVPFVLDRPVLLVVLVGHVLAVATATALSVGLTLVGRSGRIAV